MSEKLPVLESTRYVVEQSQHVTINDAAVEKMLLMNGWDHIHVDWYPELHLADAEWIFVLDALNFCFWEECGQPKWSIDYHGQEFSGYWALAGSLKRAVEEGIPMTDPEFLSTISAKTAAKIFRGKQQIPLLQARVNNLREVGTVLLEKYDGAFTNLLTSVNCSAIRLVEEIVANFSSFNDIATYNGKTIYLYKRAQLLAADLYGAFEGEGFGWFRDLDELTIFADYKLPQVLRHYDVLQYDEYLSRLVDSYTLFAPGSAEEVEIRAATIQTVEHIRLALTRNTQRSIPAYKLDWWLWNLGQNDAVRTKPYHRARTMFY